MATGVVEGQGRLVEVEAAQVAAAERRPAGEEKTFRPYDPDQVLLMAPVLAGVDARRAIWRTSSRIWSRRARWTCRRSMRPMRRSVAIRRMTRG